MPKNYSRDFKSMLVSLIKDDHHSTIQTAERFGVPLKTLEKWITAFNKDNKVFQANYLSPAQQIDILKKEVSRLKNENDVLKKTISYLATKN